MLSYIYNKILLASNACIIVHINEMYVTTDDISKSSSAAFVTISKDLIKVSSVLSKWHLMAHTNNEQILVWSLLEQ